jgi:adenosine deaminase
MPVHATSPLRRRRLLALLLSACAVGAPTHAAPADTARTAAWFDAHKTRTPLVRQFLQRMPKGADLHSHLSGAVYAESYLGWAAQADLCVDTAKKAILSGACAVGDGQGPAPGQVPASKLGSDAAAAMVDRMSMRNLAASGRSGHDQFFDAFSVFGPVTDLPGTSAAMLAELTNRAAAQNILHLELMNTVQGGAVRRLGGQLAWADEPDLARRHRWLLEHGLPALVEAGQRNVDTIEREHRQLQGCDTPAAKAGCGVSVRWLQQTTRTNPPEQVFAQLAYAFALAQADRRVVGLNLVAPEDHPVALRDYRLQMEMIGFLSKLSPDVKIALHAGELVLGLVPPQHLGDHIRDAVRVAGAHRIGHAVDIGHEHDAFETMQAMKQRGVAAEICLTSNDGILGVKGQDHPLPDYLAAGVPVVLASDDEGISRIDLSNEYVRAAATFGLGYRQLKQFSRNSLEHSFLPGASLWQDAAQARPVAACRRDVPGAVRTSAACAAWLGGSERAQQQWRLEAAFEAFEQLPQWQATGRAPDRLPRRRLRGT